MKTIELSNVRLNAVGRSQVFGEGADKQTLYDYIEIIADQSAQKINQVLVPDEINAGLKLGATGSLFMVPVPENPKLKYLFATEFAGIKRTDPDTKKNIAPSHGIVVTVLRAAILPLSGKVDGPILYLSGMVWIGINFVTFFIPTILSLMYRLNLQKEEKARLSIACSFIDTVRLKGYVITE
jgi:hypothetical protein